MGNYTEAMKHYAIAFLETIFLGLKEVAIVLFALPVLLYAISLLLSPFIILNLIAEGHYWWTVAYCTPLVVWFFVLVHERAQRKLS